MDTHSLTPFGGLDLVQRFLPRIGVKAAVATGVAFAQRNARYRVGKLLLALLYPLILGLERIETTTLVPANGVFRHRRGLAAYPAPSTLRRFLLRRAP